MKERVEKKQTTPVTKGQTFTQTYPVLEDVKTEPSLHISQEVFPLCEADFLRLKHGASKVMPFASTAAITGFGMLLVPMAKFIQTKFTQTKPDIELWEWIIPFAAFLIAIILWFAAKFLPNEKIRVIKDIEAHFSEAPRTRHLKGQNK